MNIEDYEPIESVRYAGKTIGYVHFSEINRMYPGAGRFDFPGIVKALSETGYEGYLAAECLPLPTPDQAAELGLAYMRQCVLLTETDCCA